MIYIELLNQAVQTSPLTLLDIKDSKSVEYINSLLPYSTGFEIECFKKPSFNIEAFKSIPNILEVNIDAEEQRFRIPSGINGFICLQEICNQLVINSQYSDSGVHYHVDMSNTFHYITSETIENLDWVLKELESWNYKGKFNRKGISIGHNYTWLRFSSEFKTAEFRLGEMTFDYQLMVKRIIHANDIVRRLNNLLPNQKKLFLLDKQEKLQEKLKELIHEEVVEDDSEDIRNHIKKRIIKNGET